MWTRRKEEEPAGGRTASPLPTATELSREGIPISTAPTRVAEPGGGAAAVGKSVVVKGQIFSREDLYVDGEVEGTIEVQEHRLTVGPNGKVHANVKAKEIIVQGTVHGNMEAGEKIEIRKEAKIVGDLRTARIAIEDGAYFKGSIDVIRAEASKAAPAPAQPVRPAATAPAASSAARPEPTKVAAAGAETKT
jgi:cytoskeletal protein CcmA (bactofilin family)